MGECGCGCGCSSENESLLRVSSSGDAGEWGALWCCCFCFLHHHHSRVWLPRRSPARIVNFGWPERLYDWWACVSRRLSGSRKERRVTGWRWTRKAGFSPWVTFAPGARGVGGSRRGGEGAPRAGYCNMTPPLWVIGVPASMNVLVLYFTPEPEGRRCDKLCYKEPGCMSQHYSEHEIDAYIWCPLYPRDWRRHDEYY